MIKKIVHGWDALWRALQHIDWLGPLALRLYLVPVFWMAGTEKLMHIDSTIAWFGNTQWGLGLPFPTVMAYLASLTEVVGAVLLLLGFATRLVAMPLFITMLVAIVTVHWEHGWLAIAGSGSPAAMRLQEVLQWLQEMHPGQHAKITELGVPVMLNNGIEFAVTYAIMLVALFFGGAGRYLSVDYYLKRWFHRKS